MNLNYSSLTRLILFFFLLTIILSCNASTNKNALPQVDTFNIENKLFYSPYCIYQLDNKNSINRSDIKKLISRELPSYNLVDSLSGKAESNEYIIELFNDPQNEYPAPGIDYLKHSGHNLSKKEMDQVQSSYKAILIAFSGRKENVVSDNIKINKIIDSLIHLKNALVTDYTTYESFNSASWKEDRVSSFSEINQDIKSQFTIHLYREDKFCRAVTLGLGKFCLPDISIQDISCNDQKTYANLINLISQTWLENPNLRVDSSLILDISSLKNDSLRISLLNSLEQDAKQSVLTKFAQVKPQQGDAYNSQFEIIFNNENYSSKQEEQQALVSQLFGASDQIEYIQHNDKILKASERAKKKLVSLKKTFNKGLAPGYSLLLKAPFTTDNGGREWMWVEVTVWTNNSIRGILQNDPFEISGLSAGAIVDVHQNEVFDYILYLPDGSQEGNETGKIISNSK